MLWPEQESVLVRAIGRGDVNAIQAAAARDGIPVLRALSRLVVVEAKPGALDALQNVAGVLSLYGAESFTEDQTETLYFVMPS